MLHNRCSRRRCAFTDETCVIKRANEVAERNREKVEASLALGDSFPRFSAASTYIIKFKSWQDDSNASAESARESRAIASRWLTLTTTYAIDARTRERVHTHTHTHTYTTKRPRMHVCTYKCAATNVDTRYLAVYVLRVHIGCHLAGIWAKYGVGKRVKRERKKGRGIVELPETASFESFARTTKPGVSSMLR